MREQLISLTYLNSPPNIQKAKELFTAALGTGKGFISIAMEDLNAFSATLAHRAGADVTAEAIYNKMLPRPAAENKS
jgi:hypothetical protein